MKKNTTKYDEKKNQTFVFQFFLRSHFKSESANAYHIGFFLLRLLLNLCSCNIVSHAVYLQRKTRYENRKEHNPDLDKNTNELNF